MLPRSVVSLFCDDIREEKTGLETLIGVYPENVNVPSFPFGFPKLGIYTRINIDVTDSPGEMAIRMSAPNKEDITLTVFSEEFIANAQAQSKKNGSPIVGLISKAVASPFTVQEAGQVRLIVIIQGVEYVGGVLNVNQIPTD